MISTPRSGDSLGDACFGAGHPVGAMIQTEPNQSTGPINDGKRLHRTIGAHSPKRPFIQRSFMVDIDQVLCR
ncbi:hypothetical protein FA13DRAFT_1724684 [Coprinellus micaceus]|uniref:Uncharacterized protein n=1 Tax=Coprinellus micaceus TaxID=71717 RepID=A0A4Y7TX47_COPMI|nr:hypothetical protein FA13DRAFT_1724684 [Coprinellus micaceus]